MIRERRDFLFGNPWGDFTTFYPKQHNLPLPLVKLGHYRRVHPTSTNDSIRPYADVKVITFQDTVTKEIHLERVIGDGSTDWSHWKLTEQGQYSNLTHPYTPRVFTKARSFTYRGVLIDTDTL